MGRFLPLLLLQAVLLAACSTQPVPDEPGTDVVVSGGGLLPPATPLPRRDANRPVAPPNDVWERIRRQLSFHTMHNAQIGAAREHYLRQSRYLELIGPRAERYLYYLVTEVERRDLPIELALLPLVESALNPFAFSNQRAAGLWQFMPATADYLGMRRDWWYDARLDVRDSTRYALDYLQALNKDFGGDWLLTLAAYNAGKGRVQRAIKRNTARGLETDYWSLELPRETRHYVPRLIALSTLIAFEEALELSLPEVPNHPVFSPVPTGGQIEMLRVAELAEIDLLELRRFNPGQLRWATAPGGSDEILVPVHAATQVRNAMAELPESDRVTWQHYRIRRGDSLITIAKRFDTQVGLLRAVNNINGNLIRAGDTLMIPNSAAWQESLAMAENSRTGVRRGYRVRRGDSLYEIATRFKITIDDIIAWNDLDPDRYLQPGQSLTLYLDGG